MTDKYLINGVEDCVQECLDGFSRLHPHLTVDVKRRVVVDAEECRHAGRVRVVSGGGSGHEPFPAGYVGKGMLTASVSGHVFSCPPSRDILHGIRLVSGGRSGGVLVLVGNYTGDVLNFGLAGERAVAEGVAVESVVVGDEVGGETRGKAGRRGMCGLVLAMKVAGYLAERGEELGTVKKWSSDVVESTGSMGLCVEACSKPGVGRLFHLGEDEVELGVGVHGEAGVSRGKMMSGGEAVQTLLDCILGHLQVVEGDHVVALLNNLGSLSLIEQWLLAGELHNQLSARQIQVARLYSGHFFTSLNMAGVQVSILKLNPHTRQTILQALDHPTTASAWPRPPQPHTTQTPVPVPPPPPPPPPPLHPLPPRLPTHQARLLANAFAAISHRLTAEELHLNHLDSVCGDGDCGTTFARMAALLQPSNHPWDFSHPHHLFSDLCAKVEESVGGTTGALYALFFGGIARELHNHPQPNPLVSSKCWRAGIDAIKKYTSARLGDRTMLDALECACHTFETHLRQHPADPRQAFRKAVAAAVHGCQRTTTMTAAAGRATYVHPAHQNDVDPGAYAVTVWLSAIQHALEEPQHPTGFSHSAPTSTTHQGTKKHFSF